MSYDQLLPISYVEQFYGAIREEKEHMNIIRDKRRYNKLIEERFEDNIISSLII